MNLPVNIGICATEFTFTHKKVTGEVISTSGPHLNTILNSGLTYLNQPGSTNLLRYIYFGDSGVAPNVNQVGLQGTFVAMAQVETGPATYTVIVNDVANNVKIISFYGQYTVAPTTTEYTVRECGLAGDGGGGYSSGLYNRVLLRDALNNPTAYTIQPGELLRVNTVTRIRIPLSTVSSINLVDSTNGTTLATRTITINPWTPQGETTPGGNFRTLITANTEVSPIPTFSNTDSKPWGLPGIVSTVTYPTPYSRLLTGNLTTAQNAITIGTILFGVGGLGYSGGFAIHFDTALVKSAIENFEIKLTLSWSRA